MRTALARRLKGGLRYVRGSIASLRRPARPSLGDLVVSGFNEKPPVYPGGVWLLRRGRLRPLYEGYGVFGLAWSARHRLIIGTTRVEDVPLVAFRPLGGGRYASVVVEYERWVQPFRAHGVAVREDKLYLVATQGDPGAPVCTNDDFRDHRVGKVIISTIELVGDRLRVRDSVVWNPYQCGHHHHYNDLLLLDDGIYVSSFSVCAPDGAYVARGALSRFGYDLSTPTIALDALEAPHSPFVLDGKLYLCSSGDSSVVSAPLGGALPLASKLEFKSLDNFVRGLHVTPDAYVIGLNRSAGRSHAEHLKDSMNGLLIVDRRNGSVTRAEMPPSCDNVYSILAVPESLR